MLPMISFSNKVLQKIWWEPILIPDCWAPQAVLLAGLLAGGSAGGRQSRPAEGLWCRHWPPPARQRQGLPSSASPTTPSPPPNCFHLLDLSLLICHMSSHYRQRSSTAENPKTNAFPFDAAFYLRILKILVHWTVFRVSSKDTLPNFNIWYLSVEFGKFLGLSNSHNKKSNRTKQARKLGMKVFHPLHNLSK